LRGKIGKSAGDWRYSIMKPIDQILAAFTPEDFDRHLINRLCQYRSDPSTKFDDVIRELEQKLAWYRETLSKRRRKR
jgi:hypothetical protein